MAGFEVTFRGRFWVTPEDNRVTNSTYLSFLAGVFLSIGTNILVGLAFGDLSSAFLVSDSLFLGSSGCMIAGAALVFALGRRADQLKDAPREAGRETIARMSITSQSDDDTLDALQAAVEAEVEDLMVISYKRLRRWSWLLLFLALFLAVSGVAARPRSSHTTVPEAHTAATIPGEGKVGSVVPNLPASIQITTNPSSSNSNAGSNANPPGKPH